MTISFLSIFIYTPSQSERSSFDYPSFACFVGCSSWNYLLAVWFHSTLVRSSFNLDAQETVDPGIWSQSICWRDLAGQAASVGRWERNCWRFRSKSCLRNREWSGGERQEPEVIGARRNEGWWVDGAGWSWRRLLDLSPLAGFPTLLYPTVLHLPLISLSLCPSNNKHVSTSQLHSFSTLPLIWFICPSSFTPPSPVGSWSCLTTPSLILTSLPSWWTHWLIIYCSALCEFLLRAASKFYNIAMSLSVHLRRW